MMMSVAFMGLSSVLWVLADIRFHSAVTWAGVIGNLKWFAFNGVGAEAGHTVTLLSLIWVLRCFR